MSNASQYDEYRNTPLWRAIAEVVAELEATGEVEVRTAPDYVVGFMCRELAAKWVIAGQALTRER